MAAPATPLLSVHVGPHRFSEDEQPLSASVVVPGLNTANLARIRALEGQLSALETAHDDRDRTQRGRIFTLSQQVDALNRQHRVDESALRTNEEARLRLQAQLDELTATNRANQEQIATLTGQIAALRSENTALTRQMGLLADQLQATQTQFQAAITHGQEQAHRIDRLIAVAQTPQQQPPASPPSKFTNWFVAALSGPFAVAELVEKEFS